MRDRLENFQNKVQEFEGEKQKLKYENNIKMNELEQKITGLETELSKAH